MKKFFQEFKEFAMRGNVLDMAVGVVVGSAFTAIGGRIGLSVPPAGHFSRAGKVPKSAHETIRFLAAFFAYFCRCWQKVCRRRQKTLCEKETRRRHEKENADGNSSPSETAKKNCKGYYGLPRVLRTLAMTLLNVSK